MGIQKVTFEGANVTAEIDSELYHYLFSLEIGILKGLKKECRCSLSNNMITISDGYVSVYGRIIYIENKTQIVVTPDSTKFGYVVLGVDTLNNTVKLYLKELQGSYPPLIKTVLDSVRGLYELVICAYKKTNTSVTLDNGYKRKIFINDKAKVELLESDIKTRYLPIRKTLIKVSNGAYQVVISNQDELFESTIYLTINNSVLINFLGEALMIFSGSNTSFSYRFANADFTLGIMYENNILSFTCGSTMHKITALFIKK